MGEGVSALSSGGEKPAGASAFIATREVEHAACIRSPRREEDRRGVAETNDRALMAWEVRVCEGTAATQAAEVAATAAIELSSLVRYFRVGDDEAKFYGVWLLRQRLDDGTVENLIQRRGARGNLHSAQWHRDVIWLVRGKTAGLQGDPHYQQHLHTVENFSILVPSRHHQSKYSNWTPTCHFGEWKTNDHENRSPKRFSKITPAFILTGPRVATTRVFSKTADVDHTDLNGKSYHETSVLIGVKHPCNSTGLAFQKIMGRLRHFSDPGIGSSFSLCSPIDWSPSPGSPNRAAAHRFVGSCTSAPTSAQYQQNHSL